MSYYIYCIAYRITDEIKAKKEAEKPFWWEHLHAEVKEKPIEEIEKLLLEGGIPKEKLDEMSKHEKYLAVSEGCYVVDCKEHEKEIAEMESLRKQVEMHRTSFLNKPFTNNALQSQEEFKPVEFGKTGDIPINVGGNEPLPSPIPPIDNMAAKMDESPFSSNTLNSAMSAPKPNLDVDDEHFKILSENISDDDLKDDSPFNKNVASNGMDMGGGNAGGMSKPEIRKYAQSIVRQTVQQINHKADEIPDDVAIMKENELLQAVINELQTLKH